MAGQCNSCNGLVAEDPADATMEVAELLAEFPEYHVFPRLDFWKRVLDGLLFETELAVGGGGDAGVVPPAETEVYTEEELPAAVGAVTVAEAPVVPPRRWILSQKWWRWGWSRGQPWRWGR